MEILIDLGFLETVLQTTVFYKTFAPIELIFFAWVIEKC